MLRTRIATALALLAILITVLFTHSYLVFAITLIAFFAAAIWENFRLFKSSHPLIGTFLWGIVLAIVLFNDRYAEGKLFFTFCIAIWIIRLMPSLMIGLPPLNNIDNRLLNGVYSIAILGCFIATAALFMRSPLYLLSVMAIVWIADTGAYFFGRAFGRHKLAPSISPGKSWEGALGGWLAVLVFSVVSIFSSALDDTFAVQVQRTWGWVSLISLMTFLTVLSVVGDLFESQLKRRAGVKDSSNVLPGHGGILDRIDALIPVLPFAALVDTWR